MFGRGKFIFMVLSPLIIFVSALPVTEVQEIP